MEEDFMELGGENHSLFVPMAAGAIAGVLEHCVMYPIDSIKTRIQILNSQNPNSNIKTIFRHMMVSEGPLSFYRGMNAVVIGSAPAHALYFGCYEASKKIFSSLTPSIADTSLMYGLSGCIATFFHDAIINPCDVVKQRLQMDNSKYRNMRHCFSCVYKREGITAFYRSFPLQLMMNLPFNSLNFVIYENCCKFLTKNRLLKEPVKCHSPGEHEHEHYNPGVHLVAGSIAGGIAAALTTPIDVLKTQLNTQNVMNSTVEVGCPTAKNNHINSTSSNVVVSGGSCVCNSPSLLSNKSVPLSGAVDAFNYVYQSVGVKGFFRGTMARVLYTAPSCAICWSVYELFKNLLKST